MKCLCVAIHNYLEKRKQESNSKKTDEYNVKRHRQRIGSLKIVKKHDLMQMALVKGKNGTGRDGRNAGTGEDVWPKDKEKLITLQLNL